MTTDHDARPDPGPLDTNDVVKLKPKHIEIEVNTKPVLMARKEATGFEIKEAAIAQGVRIEIGFVLQQELPNGSSAIIGDADTVRSLNHARFTAIAPDDNS